MLWQSSHLQPSQYCSCEKQSQYSFKQRDFLQLHVTRSPDFWSLLPDFSFSLSFPVAATVVVDTGIGGELRGVCLSLLAESLSLLADTVVVLLSAGVAVTAPVDGNFRCFVCGGAMRLCVKERWAS